MLRCLESNHRSAADQSVFFSFFKFFLFFNFHAVPISYCTLSCDIVKCHFVIVRCTAEYFSGSPASLTRSLSPNSVNSTNDIDIGNRLYHLVIIRLFTSGDGLTRCFVRAVTCDVVNE